MAADYLQILSKARQSAPENAAQAAKKRVTKRQPMKVLHADEKRKKGRKKARSAKQRAATAKLVRLNRAKRLAAKRLTKRKKRASLKPAVQGKARRKRRTVRMASAKRKAAGRKAARTRARNKALRREAAKKAARKRKHHPKRAHARRPKHKRRKGAKRHYGKRRHHKKRRHGRRKVRTIRRPRGRKRWPRKVKRVRRRGRVRAIKVSESHHKRRRRGRRRHRRVMENPLGGMEILVGLVTGVIGYTVSDVIDRFVVSRERKDAQGATMGQRWDTAPLSDDLIVRGGIGLAVAVVPLAAAHFVKKPVLRSALQLFGFGAGFRLAGKIATDAATYLLKDNKDYGIRLYGTELLSRHNLGLAGMPAGLGAAPCTGCGRTDGLGGSCCRNILPKPNGSPYFPPPASPTGPSPNVPPATTTTIPYNPPVVAYNPPPGIVPFPQQPLNPPPPAITPGVPPTMFVAPKPAGINGLNGLGDATAALRAFPDAYRALKANAPALMATQNGTATAAQRSAAERITAQHGQAIATFAAIESRQPGAIQQAARGLAGISDKPAVTKYRGASRWTRDDAAE